MMIYAAMVLDICMHALLDEIIERISGFRHGFIWSEWAVY